MHAVVTTEQQLYERGASLPDAKNVMASWIPPGPTATADYPTVLLKGTWLSQEQITAASEFSRFLRKPEQLGELAKLGFRTDGGETPKSDVTNFAPVSAPLSVGDSAMRATLANALTAPAGAAAGNRAVTIMLDQSMNAQEGGKTRLANVTAALDTGLQSMPPTSAVGLWTFDGVEGRSEVPTGPLADPVDGRPRSAALAATLDDQAASSGGAVSFTTLRLLYDDALAKFRQGQTNSVLVITAGPHTDQSLDGGGLQDYVRRTFDSAKPVAINVIDFGGDPDRATWEAIARDDRWRLPEPVDVDVAGPRVGDHHVPRVARRAEDRTGQPPLGAPPPSRLPSWPMMSTGLGFGGGGASVFCHSWHSLDLKVVSPGSICTVCGFLVIALATVPSPLDRFQ